MEPPPLTLHGDDMRRLGYEVIDMLVDHFESLSEQPATHQAAPQDLRTRFDEPIPENPISPDDVLRQIEGMLTGTISHVDHPRFFGFIPSPNNFVSVMADALASGLNVFSGSWISGAGAAVIEEQTIDWLREMCGFPEAAGGLFVSGGSMANLTALAAARHERLADASHDAVAYFSDQTHSSVERALTTLGFRTSQLRRLPSDHSHRLDVRALAEAVESDRNAGRVPFCVVANGGTTNTGAVDPLESVADLCAEASMWFHVDGAYGAASVLSERGRKLLRGMERADSLALDPHKWLFQPYEIGCVLVHRRETLRETFRILPEYLEDTRREQQALNFCDYGVQLTRSFRALKLWMSLKAFGARAFREAVERGFDLAETAERELRRLSDWRVVTPAQLAVVTFRYEPEGFKEQQLEQWNRMIVQRLSESGYAFLSTTQLRRRTTLRMCTINPRTTEEDIRGTIGRLDDIARTIAGQREA